MCLENLKNYFTRKAQKLRGNSQSQPAQGQPCYRLGWRNKNRWSLGSERQSAQFETSKVEKGRKGSKGAKKVAKRCQKTAETVKATLMVAYLQ